MLSVARPLDWVVFAATVAAMIGLDVAFFGRKARAMTFREAVLRSLMAIAGALAFTLWIHLAVGGGGVSQAARTNLALEYLIAFVVEKSLSVDNLFVFLVVFGYFRVGERQQQRVLLWGLAGAVVMRLVFILAGSALLHRFHWMIYVFGGVLVWTGLKLAFKKDDDVVDPGNSPVLRLAKRWFRTTDQYEGEHFFTVRDGVRYATPLFLVVLVIEFTDLLFAVDSVPAVLAVSNDLFVVYTSNVMAILGLRALFFLLAGMMSRFRYLDVGVAMILVFIGAKMIASPFLKVPNLVSLGVILLLLVGAVVVSMLRPPPPESEGDGDEGHAVAPGEGSATAARADDT
ncbi:MAG: TerC/Alx family metal homeostasis membrane protein [Polyangiaceae bacterium]|nr:TerC/Alx family metal homeostasis membrane protein [Polyangiaceae bacterium]